MRLRSRERNRGGILDIPKKIIIKITSKSIPVRNEPSRLGLIVCQLQKDYIVKVNEECEVDEIKWLKINSGWICSRDSNGSLCYSLSHEVEANKFWASENVNRRRVASAISQLLAKGHSLTNARRVSSLLFKQSSLYVKNLKPLTNLPDVSIEDLVIALTTSSGLKATEIFEFMKVAASQQSDPPKALLDMATQINDTMNLRPSLWVKNDLGVLDTVDVVMKNDIFVMACARNDLKKFDECLAKGQELAAIHSELKYTGLHAAADFGAKDIVERLLLAGISPNVRDARHGRTALHFAAQSGRCEIAILLLEKGADRSLADFSGSLSCEIADDQGHAECREILKQIPPEIQYAQVTHCTDKSITIQWIPPVIISHIHAKVDEFMVIHEPIDKKYGAGQSYSTKQVYLTVSDLAPSTGHGFVVMSHSVSGWSQPSAKLIHFTLPAAPTAPSIIELIKVTKNGLLITWQPPDNENGGPVDLYHIEMTDKDMICNDYSVTDSNVNSSRSLQNDNDDSDNSDNDDSTNTNSNSNNNNNNNNIKRKLSTTSLTSQLSEDTIGTELHMNNGKMLPKTLADDIPGTTNNLLDGKWHRLIKHRDVSHRSKYVMGLETYRNYYFRCTCRNEFGWSPWSNWSGPYTPQEGVQVRQFGDNWIRIGWIEPQLAKNRQVDCYEVQMSTPTGPMSTSIALYKSKLTQKSQKSLKSNKKKTNQPEFKTIDSNCIKAEVIAKNLKAGKKYQFRVRPKINGEWVEWDLCVLSDVITMPSSAPDAPQNLHVIRIKNHSVILTNRSSKIDISVNTNKINDQNNSLATISLLTTPTKVTSTTGTSLVTSNSNYTYNSNNSYNTYDNSYNNNNNNNNKESSKKTMVRSSKEIQPKINQDKQFHPTTSFSKITVNHATRPSRLVQSNNRDDDSFESRSDNDDNDNGEDDDNDNNGDDENDNDDEDNESNSNSSDNNDDHNDNEDNSQSDNSNSDDEQDNEKLNLSTRGTLPPFDDDDNDNENNDEIELQITHNSIDLEWKNGTPNGSAILGCEVQCCKVKEYCIDDLEKASKAAGKEEAWDDEITGLNKIDALNWVNITEKGIFLSGQSFRALGLTSGVGYIFRVRQRNDVHWSSFSRATSIITTLLSAPPCQPEVIMTSSSHIVIQWTIQTNTTFIFSGLESNIQIAKLDLTVPLNQPVPSSLIKDLVWERAEYRSCNKNINDDDDDNNNQNKIHSVERMIIDNLLPMTCYTVRVRIRTVAGWTSWSELSYPFRTLALP